MILSPEDLQQLTEWESSHNPRNKLTFLVGSYWHPLIVSHPSKSPLPCTSAGTPPPSGGSAPKIRGANLSSKSRRDLDRSMIMPGQTERRDPDHSVDQTQWDDSLDQPTHVQTSRNEQRPGQQDPANS